VASRQRGFTLLEVLVAVALLGLVVSVLAGSAIQGMSYEGDAARRMRASLLADRALWQVEAALKLGAPPQPSHEESQEGEEFGISVDVQPSTSARRAWVRCCCPHRKRRAPGARSRARTARRPPR
jgi:prepilin-type N-terminal cleavage/methylation domain-containing protein